MEEGGEGKLFWGIVSAGEEPGGLVFGDSSRDVERRGAGRAERGGRNRREERRATSSK